MFIGSYFPVGIIDHDGRPLACQVCREERLLHTRPMETRLFIRSSSFSSFSLNSIPAEDEGDGGRAVRQQRQPTPFLFLIKLSKG